MFLQDFMAKKRFLHILASFLECKKAIFFKSFPRCHFMFYNAEKFFVGSSNPMAWVVKRTKLNSKKVFFWDTLVPSAQCTVAVPLLLAAFACSMYSNHYQDVMILHWSSLNLYQRSQVHLCPVQHFLRILKYEFDNMTSEF